MPVTIGIDLGGTNVRAGLCAGELKIVGRVEEESRAKGEPDALVDQLVAVVEQLSGKTDEAIVALGVGVPGIHDAINGVIHQSPHFPQWQDYPLRDRLSERLEYQVVTDNDANMWAMGEARYGAGQGKDHVLCLTLGTGIGGGIISAGEIYHGERGFAGEVGHMVVKAEGPPCACGNRGCWELYASAQGIVRLVAEAEEGVGKSDFLKRLAKDATAVSAADVGEAADTGDEFAREIWRRFGRMLGIGITSLVNVLGIHTVVIGGGLSRSWPHFNEAMQVEFRQRSYREFAKITQIVPAQLGTDAGIIGAGYAASKLP